MCHSMFYSHQLLIPTKNRHSLESEIPLSFASGMPPKSEKNSSNATHLPSALRLLLQGRSLRVVVFCPRIRAAN